MTPAAFAAAAILCDASIGLVVFSAGTKTVQGLSGISFQVGAKVTGTPTGPIVFYWHGTGSTAAEGRRFPGISEIMQKGGVFVSFGRSKGTGGDCSGTGSYCA